MTDKPKNEVRDAYENARDKMPAEYPRLPAWEQLPIQMRSANCGMRCARATLSSPAGAINEPVDIFFEWSERPISAPMI